MSDDFKIMITGSVKGTYGDLAIDDTSLIKGDCFSNPHEVNIFFSIIINHFIQNQFGLLI